MKLTIVVAFVVAVIPPIAYGQDSPDVMGRSMLEDSAFKLRAERFGMHDLPNFELKDWPQKPEIDATVVNQIDSVKNEVPEWHGLHHIVPGSGAAKN